MLLSASVRTPFFRPGRLRKQHAITPTRAMKLPKYRPHDQPARDAIKGVKTGARKPPRFPPVLRIAQAAPTCLRATSMADAQNGPSHQEANPVASDSDRTERAVPGT